MASMPIGVYPRLMKLPTGRNMLSTLDVHNKSSSSSSGADNSFGPVVMYYDEFEVTITDINEEVLVNIGQAEDVKHLSIGTFRDPAFPVRGILYGPNFRFMVPLVFQRARKPSSPILYVWCLVDTGSPFTCLTVKTLEAFVGTGNIVDGQYYPFAIQNQQTRVECQVSKVGSNFEHVNILGVNALRVLNLSLIVDWVKYSFSLSRM